MSRLRTVWSGLHSSLWFVPSGVVLASVLTAVMMIEADGLVGAEMTQQWPRVLGAGAEASRAILSAIATSMITVAGVVFSITIVALSQTSTQYSPRVLRNFMRDRPTQAVLGVFTGVFVYCLIVLRAIRGASSGQEEFIPSLAVLGGMAYALGGIALLIFFIHHVAQSIQAASILDRISVDTAEAIDKLFPEEVGHAAAPDLRGAFVLPTTWTPVTTTRDGYVTDVDSERIMEFAVQHGRVLRLAAAIGDFVAEGAPILELEGPDAVRPADQRRLRGWVSMGLQRTVEQDAAFCVQQLVDVAVKALSPGINDPTTACMCLDRLGAALARLAPRRIPDTHRMAHGQLRVIAPAPDFAFLLKLAFDALVAHSRGDVQVLTRALDALALIEEATLEPRRRASVAGVARNVYRELLRVEPRVRAAAARRRARSLERLLRRCQAAPATR